MLHPLVRFRTVALASLFVAGVSFLGAIVGSEYGRHRSNRRETGRLRAETLSLRSNVKGIHVGAPFPALTLWTVDGDQPVSALDLLPRGGTLLLLGTGCDQCLGHASLFAAASEAVISQGLGAILVADQLDGAHLFADEAVQAGIHMPVYCDVQQSMRLKHQVAANPAYFCVDSQGRVIEFGAGVPSAAQLTHALSLE